MKLRIYTFMLILLAGFSSAKSADWKFVGKSAMHGVEYYGFYDEQTKERKSNGNLEVWIKFVSVRQIDSISIARHDTLIELIAEKIVSKYYPPYAFIQPDTSYDAMLAVLQMEVIANTFKMATRLMIHSEFNCKQRKSRVLSSIFYNDLGEVENNSRAKNEWSDVVPESSGESILKVLCSRF